MAGVSASNSNQTALRTMNTSPASLQQTVYKVNGKVTVTTRGLLSKDGKTLTVRVTGTSADGKPANSTYVYEKQ
jgi:hypothetical protein